MRFFQTAFAILAVVGLINLADAFVSLSLRSQVYACSDVDKSDPINVQKKCRKA